MKRSLFILGVLFLGMAINAKADSISFSDQPAGPTGFLASTGPHSVTEGLATFSGGTILTNEFAAIVTGNVYATVSNSIVPPPFTFLNPLTITFSQAVSNLSLVVVNNEADTYVLRDTTATPLALHWASTAPTEFLR